MLFFLVSNIEIVLTHLKDTTNLSNNFLDHRWQHMSMCKSSIIFSHLQFFLQKHIINVHKNINQYFFNISQQHYTFFTFPIVKALRKLKFSVFIGGCQKVFAYFIDKGRPVEVKEGGKISLTLGLLIIICYFAKRFISIFTFFAIC